jgi:hypothetical protein
MPTPEDYAADKLATLLNPEREEPTNPRNRPGPKTPEGKKRSAMNALRHGLSGRIVVLPTEDMAEYLKFSKAFVEDLFPATLLEREIAQSISNGYWRLKRFQTVEESLLALGHYEGEGDFDAEHENIHAAFTAAKSMRTNHQAFATLSIYEQRIRRGIHNDLKQLKELQHERSNQRLTHMTDAVRLHELNKMQHLPYNPADDGFVYSPAQVEAEIDRRTRREQADLARQVDYNIVEFQKRTEKIAA